MTQTASWRRKTLGWGFIVLGVLGTILPFLQGFLFISLGIFILRDQYRWSSKMWQWLEKKWPNATKKVESLEHKIQHKWKNFFKTAGSS